MGRPKHQPVVAETAFKPDQQAVIDELTEKVARLERYNRILLSILFGILERSEVGVGILHKMQKLIDVLPGIVCASGEKQVPVLKDLLKTTAQAAEWHAAREGDANSINAMLVKENRSQGEQIVRLEKADELHNGGSTPTSHKSITQRQIEAEKKRKQKEQQEQEQKPPKKKGPPKGHKGVSCNWNYSKRTWHMFATCPCGKPAEPICFHAHSIKRSTKEGVYDELCFCGVYECEECGQFKAIPDYVIPGTSLDSEIVGKAVQSHGETSGNMGDLHKNFAILMGVNVARNTISNGVKRGVAARLKPECKKIQQGIGEGKSGNIDETGMPIEDGLGRVFVCASDGWVYYYAAFTRGREELWKMGVNPQMKVTTDAYAIYLVFAILQFCWSHAKTKVKNAATKLGTQIMQYLYGQLMEIFFYAKTLGPDTPQTTIDDLIIRVKKIGQQIVQAGASKAGNYINCADKLFTAVSHPDMSLTNNLAERLLRGPVIKRKTIQRFATMEGAQTYCNIKSCLEPWKAQKKDPHIEMARLFAAR